MKNVKNEILQIICALGELIELNTADDSIFMFGGTSVIKYIEKLFFLIMLCIYREILSKN